MQVGNAYRSVVCCRSMDALIGKYTVADDALNQSNMKAESNQHFASSKGCDA